MTRSTLSRRARNSASVMTGRRRPASRPSRRRCFLASRRVEPLTRCGSVIGSGWRRGWRTRTTVLGASSPSRGLSPERRRVRRRAAVEVSPSSPSVLRPAPRLAGAGNDGRQVGRLEHHGERRTRSAVAPASPAPSPAFGLRRPWRASRPSALRLGRARFAFGARASATSTAAGDGAHVLGRALRAAASRRRCPSPRGLAPRCCSNRVCLTESVSSTIVGPRPAGRPRCPPGTLSCGGALARRPRESCACCDPVRPSRTSWSLHALSQRCRNWLCDAVHAFRKTLRTHGPVCPVKLHMVPVSGAARSTGDRLSHVEHRSRAFPPRPAIIAP